MNKQKYQGTELTKNAFHDIKYWQDQLNIIESEFNFENRINSETDLIKIKPEIKKQVKEKHNEWFESEVSKVKKVNWTNKWETISCKKSDCPEKNKIHKTHNQYLKILPKGLSRLMILLRTKCFPINNNTKHFRTRDENCRWCKANEITNIEDEEHVLEKCIYNRELFKDNNGTEVKIKVEDFFKCNSKERLWEMMQILKKIYNITEQDWKEQRGMDSKAITGKEKENTEIKEVKEKQLIDVEEEASEYIEIIRKQDEDTNNKESNHNGRTN